MFANLVDVFVNCLEATRILCMSVMSRGNLVIILIEFNFVHKVSKHFISPEMEKALQNLIFIIKVIHFNDKRVNFLNFLNHIQMLLSFNGVKNPFRLLAQLWKL